MKINISKNKLECLWRELASDKVNIIKCKDVDCNYSDKCDDCIFYNSQRRYKSEYTKDELIKMGRIKVFDKDMTIKYLEKMLDRMYEIEDENYVLNCWSSRLSKDIKTIEKTIELIKEWNEQYA